MSDDWLPDWIENRPGLVPVPEGAKDEFHERIFQYLARTYGWGHSARTIHPLSDPTVRVHELIPNTSAGPHISRLWIANATGGVFIWTVGTGELNDSECALWEGVVTNAVVQLGQLRPVSWRAYLAQEPPKPPYFRFQLEEPAVLQDGVTLMPAKGLITTDALTNIGQVFAPPHTSAVIQVDGSTPCYAWRGDGEFRTLRRLRLLAAVVSFAWESPWFLRDGPSDRLNATWAGAPGPLSGQHYGWSGMDTLLAPPKAPLPTWFRHVDALLAAEALRDSRLSRAILMYHEGLLIARDHPSLALVAFVASVETLVAPKKPPRCDTCGMVTGSTQRFKDAIAEVLPTAEAERLASAYNQRSRTAHDARLHGRELTAGGVGLMSLYVPDDAAVFEVGVLHVAQQASRALLVRNLGIQDVTSDAANP